MERAAGSPIDVIVDPAPAERDRPPCAFGVGFLRWSTRVEAYLLLLDDAYHPFALE